MNTARSPSESLAAEASLAFLRYALDSLERAEHFAANARLPETYIELRDVRPLLIRAVDHLTAAASTEVPLLRRTYLPGGHADPTPAAKPGKSRRRNKHE